MTSLKERLKILKTEAASQRPFSGNERPLEEVLVEIRLLAEIAARNNKGVVSVFKIYWDDTENYNHQKIQKLSDLEDQKKYLTGRAKEIVDWCESEGLTVKMYFRNGINRRQKEHVELCAFWEK